MTAPEHRQQTSADMDVDHLALIRENVRDLMRRAGEMTAGKPGDVLDVAPQDHEGGRPFLGDDLTITTFDIDPESGADIIGDICGRNPALADASFDHVLCTEVLEHTLQPFAAVAEIKRVLKPGGLLFLSVPFNFRIHGPLPDCWRFTEHGLRALLADFAIIELLALETPDRPLMPIHYTVIARKPN